MVPLFQNFGSILNIEDFQGPIELSGCTVEQNLISVKDLQYGLNDTQTDSDYNQISFYKDLNDNSY